jgi:predicted enzyme related to lactoylglutathione lyase
MTGIMNVSRNLAICSAFVATTVLAAADAAVDTIAFDNVHIRVTDPQKAAAWYTTYLGATMTPAPHRVSFGRTLIIFAKSDNIEPSRSIDHLGISYANVDARIKDIIAGGAKVLASPVNHPGLFRAAFIEDPFGVKIEVLEDPQLLGFHHVHLQVPNPGATLSWYQQMFGGQRGKLKGLLDGLLYPSVPRGVAGHSEDARSRGGIWLLADEGPKLPPTATRVLYTFSFLVGDVKQAAARLKNQNVTIIREPFFMKMDGSDTGVVFTQDPDGVQVDLFQRAMQ